MQADFGFQHCYDQAAPGHGISGLPSSVINEGVQQHGLVLCIGHAGRGTLLAEHGAALINVGKVGCMTPCTALHAISDCNISGGGLTIVMKRTGQGTSACVLSLLETRLVKLDTHVHQATWMWQHKDSHACLYTLAQRPEARPIAQHGAKTAQQALMCSK